MVLGRWLFYRKAMGKRCFLYRDRRVVESFGRPHLAVYLSGWAAQGAIRYYGLDPAKVRVVPGGANLDSGLEPGEVEAVVAGRPSNHCWLLFVATR